MMERIRRAQKDDGFTLIEVLVVISILGILAGIVVFAVGGIADRGQESACKTEKKTVQTAVQAYLAKPPAGGPASPGTSNLVGLYLADTPTWYTVTGGTVSGSGACSAI